MTEIVHRTPEQVFDLWVNALRSGEYRQTKGYLKKSSGFCCLGVLCDLSIKDGGRGEWSSAYYDNPPTFIFGHANFEVAAFSAMPPVQITDYLGLTYEEAVYVASMNDKGKSFSEIADYIENKLKPAALSRL